MYSGCDIVVPNRRPVGAVDVVAVAQLAMCTNNGGKRAGALGNAALSVANLYEFAKRLMNPDSHPRFQALPVAERSTRFLTPVSGGRVQIGQRKARLAGEARFPVSPRNPSGTPRNSTNWGTSRGNRAPRVGLRRYGARAVTLSTPRPHPTTPHRHLPRPLHRREASSSPRRWSRWWLETGVKRRREYSCRQKPF